MVRPAMDTLALACLATASFALRGPCTERAAALRGSPHGALLQQVPVTTPCPCLVTPAPLVSREEAASTEVTAAADEAMAEGIAEVQAAAESTKTFWMTSIQQYNMDEHVIKKSQNILRKSMADQMQLNNLTLEAEYARQHKDLKQMEKDAQDAARDSATKVRVTAAQWASHQAQQDIVQEANSTVGGALVMARQTAQLRQQATAFAAQAISSARQTLQVAQEAQRRAEEVPEEVLKTTEQSAEELKAKQEELRKQMAKARSQAELASDHGVETDKLADHALQQASDAEAAAQQALDTARENSAKIAKLKDRATAIVNKAEQAGEVEAAML